MSYRKSEYRIYTGVDTLRQMARLASQYQTDMAVYSHLSPMQLFVHLQNKYRREVGEVLQRPEITMQYGGDCDDQAIVSAATLLLRGVPASNIYFCEASESKKGNPVHVFCSVLYGDTVFNIDPLPGNQFGAFAGYLQRAHSLEGLLK